MHRLALFLVGALACAPSVATPEPTRKSPGEPSSPDSAAGDLGRAVAALPDGVRVVHRDLRGRVWFAGGDAGLFAYADGALRRYSTSDGLCDTEIIEIVEDARGRVYFDARSCVARYDGREFFTLPISAATEESWALESDDLWFRMGWSRQGPLRWDGEMLHQLTFPETARERAFDRAWPRASYEPQGLYSIYRDRGGAVWFGTASLGLARWDGETLAWMYEEGLTRTPSGGDFGIRSIVEDDQGALWICNGRQRFHVEAGTETRDGESRVRYTSAPGVEEWTGAGSDDAPYFLSIAKDREGDLWMASYERGVWRVRGETARYYDLDGARIYSVYADREGDVWLGTHERGAMRLEGETFVTFSP